MHPKPPFQVNLFSGILYSDDQKLQEALKQLSDRYGPIDFQSEEFSFEETEYYIPEMGSPIMRLFVSFENLIFPNELAKIKLECNAIENNLEVDGHRKVNLDPGYMDYDKVVLASAKYNGNKIYLDAGIWADLTLSFKERLFQAYPWSFPDFKTGRYQDVFQGIRQLYKLKMRGNSHP